MSNSKEVFENKQSWFFPSPRIQVLQIVILHDDDDQKKKDN